MLETVLEIGKILRNSPNGLKHHRYIKPCPQDTYKFSVLRLSLPVKILNDGLSFDFNNITEITDENIIRDKLYYLTFKTSDADGLVKYIFGDIYYELKNGEESGYYRKPDKKNKQKAYQVSSFDRGKEDFESIKKIKKENEEQYVMFRFHEEFRKNKDKIENLIVYFLGIKKYFGLLDKNIKISNLLSDVECLKLLNAQYVYEMISQNKQSKKIFKNILGIENPIWDKVKTSNELIQKLIGYSSGSVFLHFDFQGKHWYEFNKDMDLINEKLLEDFAEKTSNGYILKKYVYKTLSSPEKDWQFPYFSPTGRYRNKIFKSQDDILNLIYAIDYSKTAMITVYKTDIKIIVLPKGNNLSAEHYENFIQKGNGSIQQEQQQEELISQQNIQYTDDSLFEPILKNTGDNFVKFDFIFSKKGGQSSPDVDLIEISGIERTHLKQINDRIKTIKKDLYEKWESEIKIEKKPLEITVSFLNILGDTTSDIKKYQSHLYKVLPKIYTGAYYQDPVLLPAFIEKVEYKVRNEDIKNLSFQIWQLKYDFYFLTYIQNTQKGGENLMKIQETISYKIGFLLGQLAKQFAAWREDCPMKSFEKSYVGTLSRRIANIQDLVKFKTFIEEKLIMHERVSFTHNTSVELAETLKKLEESTEKYDKNNCAFGFFESYFGKEEK